MVSFLPSAGLNAGQPPFQVITISDSPSTGLNQSPTLFNAPQAAPTGGAQLNQPILLILLALLLQRLGGNTNAPAPGGKQPPMGANGVVNPRAAHEYFESELAFNVSPYQLNQMLQKSPNSVQVIDVRAAADFAKGHIPGSINLPQDQWGNAAAVLSRSKNNVVLCYTETCTLAKKAAVAFSGQGFPVQEMHGGFAGWQSEGFPVVQ